MPNLDLDVDGMELLPGKEKQQKLHPVEYPGLNKIFRRI
jgi:hypothetical protein